MAILYRIKPVDKKSVEAYYDVYSKDEQGNVRSWSVTEMYRWGQGFVENEDELPHSDDKYHAVDPQLGWGCELDDLCAVDFEFDDSFTEEEKEQIEKYQDAWDNIKKYTNSSIQLNDSFNSNIVANISFTLFFIVYYFNFIVNFK